MSCQKCSKPLDSANPKHVLCTACGDAQRAERAASMVSKPCVTCGQTFQSPNSAHTECKKCYDKSHKKAPRPEAAAKASAPRRAAATASGVCKCGQPVDASKETNRLCVDCAQALRAKRNAKRRLSRSKSPSKDATKGATKGAAKGASKGATKGGRGQASAAPATKGPKQCSTCQRPVDSGNPRHRLCVSCNEQRVAQEIASAPTKKCDQCSASFQSRNPSHTACKTCFDAARSAASATPSGPKVCSSCGRPNDSTNPKHKMCVTCGEKARAERPADAAPRRRKE